MNLSLLLTGSVSDVMREEFLPEPVPLFGSLFGNVLMVNPSFKTAFYLTLLVLVFALAFRFLIFPRFKKVPGGFQAVLENAPKKSWLFELLSLTKPSTISHAFSRTA